MSELIAWEGDAGPEGAVIGRIEANGLVLAVLPPTPSRQGWSLIHPVAAAREDVVATPARSRPGRAPAGQPPSRPLLTP